MVFKFSVTSSPTKPFPLVAPRTNFPSLYSKAADKPSIFVSTTNFTSSSFKLFSFAALYTLSLNSSNSPKENISCKLCNGTSCSTFSNPSFTCPPTFCVKESFVTKSGNSFSRAFSLFIVISYS